MDHKEQTEPGKGTCNTNLHAYFVACSSPFPVALYRNVIHCI